MHKIADVFDDVSGTYIIAELSANHNGSKDLALQTIKAAAESGANAIKLQTYTADTITLNCRNEYFKIGEGTVWDGKILYDLYKEAYTPWEWHEELMAYAKNLGLECFSSPFDFSAVDFLESLNVPAYKIASFEIHDLPLIQYVAKKGKPIIISTGIATLEDINAAVQTCIFAGNTDIALLKCTSSYPAPLEEMNLKTLGDMHERFGVTVGLSDHSMGLEAPIVAVALGAKIIEKHFILDRNLGGADSSFSLEPSEFKIMVQSIRNTEKLLGRVNYDLTDKTKKTRRFGRSLFVSENIKKGESLTPQNIRSVRPADGLSPSRYYAVLGKKAAHDLEFGQPLREGDFE